MCLIHRSDLAGYFEADIEKYCLTDKVSNSGHAQSDHAYVETLLSHAKQWIKDTTGYAIFSHRWGRKELTLSDISQFEQIGDASYKSTAIIKSTLIPKEVTDLAKVPNQKPFGLLEDMVDLCDGKGLNDHQGFVKIIRFFAESRQCNCNLVWFDTGCIDKNSSAELEESIRSMFNWYRNSKICIIHLSETSNTINIRSDPWFTRGWTLQELLAPPRVKFFDSSWKPLTYSISFNDDDDDKLVCDSKQKKYFWENILYITQISDKHMDKFKPGVHQASDALRWMANRETTRDEDMAYCLIGLLGIPLTIAYGEGMQAFYRLQVEILQRTSDMGLFAWLGRSATDNSMLASEPKCFSLSVAITSLFNNDETVPITITGHGLHITLMTYEVANPEACAISPKHSKEVKLKVKGFAKEIRVVLKTWDDDKVETQNSENAGKIELAILGWIENSQYLAILLRTKNGQCKRLSTKEHIRLDLPEREREQWPESMDRYIQ